MATKSMQRTLDFLRAGSFTPAIVEKFNPYAGAYGRREDLFGFIDIIALSDKNIIAVQACGADWSPHVKKMSEDKEYFVKKWLTAGGLVLLMGWRKLKVVKKDGTKGKASRWVPRLAVCEFNEDQDLQWREVDHNEFNKQTF